jgi:hypothetical protein
LQGKVHGGSFARPFFKRSERSMLCSAIASCSFLVLLDCHLGSVENLNDRIEMLCTEHLAPAIQNPLRPIRTT